MKEPKTLKDVWYCYSGNCDSMCVKQSTPAVRKMVKRWIAFLEKESRKAATDYPHGHWQAEILKKVFNTGEK